MSDGFYESLALYSQAVAAIAFVVVLVLLWRRFIAPNVIASQQRKNAELAEAERRRDEAKAAIATAQADVTTADSDAREILASGQSEAARVRERITTSARNESERIIRNADGELDRSRAAARERLRSDLLERAVAIAREAATKVDDATNRRIIDDTVDVADRGGR